MRRAVVVMNVIIVVCGALNMVFLNLVTLLALLIAWILMMPFPKL